MSFSSERLNIALQWAFKVNCSPAAAEMVIFKKIYPKGQ
jgi:hypothetical protein